MKSYEKIEDFLEDKSFRHWVLNGDAEQDSVWQVWLAAHPSRIELLGQAKTILLELDASAKKWEPQRQEKIFLGIKDKIAASDGGLERADYPEYSSYITKIEKRVKAVLAVSLLMLLSVVGLQFFLADEKEETLTLNEKEYDWVIKSNPKGQKSIVQLPDGSSVVLNAESELRFRSDFGQRDRMIYLTGEAFFEVASDSLKPFSVYSGQLKTIALGTSFNINSYQASKVQVQLATGKVRVFKSSSENQSVDLIPGEGVAMGADSELIKSEFDLKKAFCWKEGVLLFEQTSFQDVVRSLERWYAVEIIIKNAAPKNLKISGEFNNINLKDVLESLGYAYGFDYTLKNKEVSIQFDS